MKHSAAFTKAKQMLVLNRPLYAAIIMQLGWHVDEKKAKTDTMGVDGRSGWYNPEWFDALPPEHQESVLCHEALHVVFKHHLRRGERDPQLWNVAGDFVNNLVLHEDGMSLPPGLLDEKYKGMDTETVYKSLHQDQPEGPGGKGKGNPGSGGKGQQQGQGQGDEQGQGQGNEQGQGDEQGQGGKVSTGWGDVFDMPGKEGGVASPADIAEAEAELNGRIENVLSIAKKQGNLPAGLERVLNEVLKPKHDWKSLLRNFVLREFRNDQTWMTPNKRFAWMGITLPSMQSDGLKSVVIGIDTSGSISQRDLAEFEAEVNAILSDYPTEDLSVMYCDARVHRVDRFSSDDLPIRFNPAGGGGTSFVPVFQKVEEMGIDPTVLIYFTDMYGSFPDAAPPYPVLWVEWGGGKWTGTVPFGEHCVLNAE